MIRTAVRWSLRGVGALAVLVAAAAVVVWSIWIPSPFEPPYEFVVAWGRKGDQLGQFHDPTGIAVTKDEVFVSDARNGRIQVFDLGGRFLRTFGRPGVELGELGRPMNLTIRDGTLYVPEYFNDRIQVFDLKGVPKRLIGAAGEGPGRLNAPGGVAVSADGDLFGCGFL